MGVADLIYKYHIQRFFRPFFSGIGHVLAFHRVTDSSKYSITKALEVTPEYLESVINFFLAEKIDIVSLDECHRRIASNRKNNRFVSFTFDDGYVDNLTHALPVFEKYEAPFSIFLTTGFPNHHAVIWWYLLEEFLMNHTEFAFQDNGKIYRYNIPTFQEKLTAFGNLRSFLLSSDHLSFLPRIKNILNGHFTDLYSLTRELALTWDQVIELSNHPLVTIGAHTCEHFSLKAIDESVLPSEIDESVNIIEQKTGHPVNFFAYPYGTQNEAYTREYQYMNQTKISMSFTTVQGNVKRKSDQQLHAIPRLSINENLRIPNISLYINGMTPFRDNLLNYFKF
jgi:peptidoglycan/xylan/chitin deacetylase (PgdA/CDA1 family)